MASDPGGVRALLPAQARQGPVGPLSTSPPTIGLTATTGAVEASIASRIAPIARIGPIEMIGFEGPMMIARAAPSASSGAGRGGGGGGALEADVVDRERRRRARSGTPAA